MGTIATEFDKLKWNAGNAISDFANQASSVFSSIVGDARAAVQGLFNGDVVGINVNGVPDMQAAVTSYVENLQTTLDTFAKEVDSSDAFAGEQLKSTVHEFINAIKDICNSLIGDLLEFNDQLQQYADKYTENIESTLSQSISNQAEELKAAYTPNSNTVK